MKTEAQTRQEIIDLRLAKAAWMLIAAQLAETSQFYLKNRYWCPNRCPYSIRLELFVAFSIELLIMKNPNVYK